MTAHVAYCTQCHATWPVKSHADADLWLRTHLCPFHRDMTDVQAAALFRLWLTSDDVDCNSDGFIIAVECAINALERPA